MIADLPVDAADPVARYQAVCEQMARLKESGEIELGELLAGVGGWTSPLLLSIGLKSVFRLPHRHLVTVATNVPGPRRPLYAAGRRLLELYPVRADRRPHPHRGRDDVLRPGADVRHHR